MMVAILTISHEDIQIEIYTFLYKIVRFCTKLCTERASHCCDESGEVRRPRKRETVTVLQSEREIRKTFLVIQLPHQRSLTTDVHGRAGASLLAARRPSRARLRVRLTHAHPRPRPRPPKPSHTDGEPSHTHAQAHALIADAALRRAYGVGIGVVGI